ncbi:M24 family metallopeptidase [Erysipelothrix sp. D19-032]
MPPVKPGVTLASIDKAARDVITEVGYGEYFIHRTGHGIGTEAHENLDVSETNQKIVEVGMCFSIEPGIYIPELVVFESKILFMLRLMGFML